MRCFIFLVALWLGNGILFGQKVITVSINPKIPAQYSDIFQALNDAQAGDTLYLHPAKGYYDGTDSITLVKPVVIIGGGFNNPSSQYTGLTTMLNKIIITGEADNTLIANLSATRIHFEAKDPADDLFQNITLSHNYVDRVEVIATSGVFKSDSLVIRNNISPVIFFKNWTEIGETAEISIENNILGQVANGGGENLIIRNNLFTPGIFGKTALVKLYDTNVFNNVFWGDSLRNTTGLSSCTSIIYDYNLSYRTASEGSGTENVIGTNNIGTSPEFTSTPKQILSLNTILNLNFTPKSNSRLIGNGSEGTDIGITGGRFPFTSQSKFPFPYVSSVLISNPVLGGNTLLKFTITGEYPKQ